MLLILVLKFLWKSKVREYEKCKECYFPIKTVHNFLTINEYIFYFTIVMQFTKHLTINKYRYVIILLL
jgi:hypothetical protein